MADLAAPRQTGYGEDLLKIAYDNGAGTIF